MVKKGGVVTKGKDEKGSSKDAVKTYSLLIRYLCSQSLLMSESSKS